MISDIFVINWDLSLITLVGLILNFTPLKLQVAYQVRYVLCCLVLSVLCVFVWSLLFIVLLGSCNGYAQLYEDGNPSFFFHKCCARCFA